MRTRLALLEGREDTVLLLGGSIAIRILLFETEDDAPARTENLFPGYFELNFACLAQNRGRGDFAVRIKRCDEAPGNQIVHTLLLLREVAGRDAGRDDGMVVRNLGIIEDTLRFRELLALEDGGELRIINEAIQDIRYFRINIVAEEGRIDAGIGRNLLFI